jgi:hypothetical protein
MKASYLSTSSTLDETSCKTKGNAYWTEGGKCMYSFDNSEWKANYEGEDDARKNVGWSLQFKSNEKCGDSDKFKFTI